MQKRVTLTFRYISCFSCLLALTSFSHAISGAELTQSDPKYARGYIFGITEALATFVSGNDPEEIKLVQHIKKCLLEAGINDGVMHDAVIAYIRRTPSSLSKPAFMAVYDVIMDICGRPP